MDALINILDGFDNHDHVDVNGGGELTFIYQHLINNRNTLLN